MKWLAIAFVLAGVVPASAQSKRYPPEPPDKDREAAAHSHVWESALDPERKPYSDLVRAATELLHQGGPADTAAAIDKLDAAIARMPKEAEAYALRGQTLLGLHRWAECADDLAAAEDHAPQLDTPERAAQQLSLGICQGRAGRFADAERTLARLVATNPRGEAQMRLGEVRIALGKLDEAIDALSAALEAPGGAPIAMTNWLLAAAYDRARRPSEADDRIRQAAAYDRSLATLVSPMYPFLGADESYMLGLAYRIVPPTGYVQPAPEYALLYFRRFLAQAPTSPWRRRAEEHLREVGSSATIERRIGNAPLEPDVAQAILRKAMPAMRACLAKLPSTVFEVTITKIGPRTPDSAHDRPRYSMPPEGVTALPVLNVDTVARADLDAGARCLEPLATKLALPAPKERDTFYKAAFLVIGL